MFHHRIRDSLSGQNKPSALSSPVLLPVESPSLCPLALSSREHREQLRTPLPTAGHCRREIQRSGRKQKSRRPPPDHKFPNSRESALGKTFHRKNRWLPNRSTWPFSRLSTL